MITIKTAKKQKLKESKGITLIALVITIIVLLILAGVTIATLTGDNGILKKAGDAKTQTEQAKEDENLKIAIAGSYGTDGKLNLKDLKDNLENQGISYTGGNEFPLEVTVNGENKKIDANGNVTVKLESVADSKTKGTVFKDTTTLEDTYGNQVKIPKGFKIADDSATDVTGGIVIEDATYTKTIGSQFVWIPVGTGENAIKKANKETVDIALGRYEFSKNGDGTIKTSEFSYRYYTEDTTASHNYRNAIAKNIEEFITSVKEINHGYYIGRYEAGVVDYNSSVSTSYSGGMNWTGYTGGNIKLVCKKEQQVWNYVTQNKASELSRDMYKSEAKVTSDLINSYAWDTAIVFIQKCGTESNSSTYSCTVGESSTRALQTTGTNILKATNKIDKQCNIFDMAGNCLEWTTETCSYSDHPYVIRGGYYRNRDDDTRNRPNYHISYSFSDESFRPLLYL